MQQTDQRYRGGYVELGGGQWLNELYWSVLQVNAEAAYWSSAEVADRTAPAYTEEVVEADLALLYTVGALERATTTEDGDIYTDVRDDALDEFYEVYLE